MLDFRTCHLSVDVLHVCVETNVVCFSIHDKGTYARSSSFFRRFFGIQLPYFRSFPW